MNNRGQARIAACGLAACALYLCPAAGCSQPERPQADSRPQQRVEPSLVDRAEFDAEVISEKGNVVLVDCWATWCLPCIEQLPHSIELAKKHGVDGLAVVTLSFDDADAAEQVGKVLAEAGAVAGGATNLQSKFGGSSQSMEAFEVSSGALPYYKLYDRTGKLRRTFALDPSAKRQFTPADIDAAVVELLAE